MNRECCECCMSHRVVSFSPIQSHTGSAPENRLQYSTQATARLRFDVHRMGKRVAQDANHEKKKKHGAIVVSPKIKIHAHHITFCDSVTHTHTHYSFHDLTR